MKILQNTHNDNKEELRVLAKKDFGSEGHSLGKVLDNYQQKVDILKLAIIEKVKNLPDNPRITRQPDSTAFTVSIKDLGEGQILSAFYHDFKAQYQQLADWIETETPERILHIIGHIFKFGYWKGRRFHPDVIGHLRSIPVGGDLP